jgi:dTDP-glucose 4,6-dehydratase
LKEHRPRAVVHFAAETHVDRSIDGPGEFVRTNAVGTFALLEAVLEYWQGLPERKRQAFRFLHVSTDEVYGPADGAMQFSEGDRYRPSSVYAASKAAADHFVESVHRTYGLPALVTHCTNNYGPRQYPEKLIPLMIGRAAAGMPLPVYGDGGQIRDWLHVEDHCRALLAVLQRGRPGETYHIAAGEPRTNLEVVQAICRLVDEASPGRVERPRESLIRFVADRPAHDRRYALNRDKITRELNWKPRVGFEEGLAATVEWNLQHSDWIAEVTEGWYDLGRLGLSA